MKHTAPQLGWVKMKGSISNDVYQIIAMKLRPGRSNSLMRVNSAGPSKSFSVGTPSNSSRKESTSKSGNSLLVTETPRPPQGH